MSFSVHKRLACVISSVVTDCRRMRSKKKDTSRIDKKKNLKEHSELLAHFSVHTNTITANKQLVDISYCVSKVLYIKQNFDRIWKQLRSIEKHFRRLPVSGLAQRINKERKFFFFSPAFFLGDSLCQPLFKLETSYVMFVGHGGSAG